MKKLNGSHYINTALLTIICMTLSSVAMASNYQLPEGALGMVTIEAPKSGSLMRLRGVAGEGYLLQRVSPLSCVRNKIHLAAGDFGGNTVEIRPAGPIVLAIYSTHVMELLTNKEEVISDFYRISMPGQDRGDIEIIRGLTDSYSFVLNPDEWSIFNLFKQRSVDVSC